MTRAYQVATGHNIGWEYNSPPDILSLGGPQFMQMDGGNPDDVLVTDGAGNLSFRADRVGSPGVLHDNSLSGDGTTFTPLSVVRCDGGTF